MDSKKFLEIIDKEGEGIAEDELIGLIKFFVYEVGSYPCNFLRDLQTITNSYHQLERRVNDELGNYSSSGYSLIDRVQQLEYKIQELEEENKTLRQEIYYTQPN